MSVVVANVVSWTLLILGLSYLLQARAWARFVRAAIDAPQQILPMVLVVLVLGLFVVWTHNVWVLDWPVVVTIVGWAMAVKGTVYLIAPQTLRIFRRWSEDGMRRYITGAGTVVTILGVLLVYESFSFP